MTGEARRLSYVLTLEDKTQEAMGQMEGGLAKIHGGFLGIPTVAFAAAAGIVSVGVAAERIAEELIGAGIEAAKLGVEWQHTTTNLAAAADISIAKAQEMGAAFQQLGSQVPQSGIAISEAYQKVAGRLELFTGEAQSAAQASELMRTAAEGAVAGNQSLDAATGALVQQMLASHSTIEEQAHVMDVLFNTSRLTGAGYEEMSLIMGRLQARMGEAAPKIQDVGLAMAIMTEAGLAGARGMMVVTQMLNALTDPSEKAKQDLDALGVSIQKNADGSLNLRGTLQELTAAFANIDNPVTRHALAVELVGKQYAGVFESAMKSAANNLDGLADKINKTNSALDAAGLHARDISERWEKLNNQAQALAQNIGGVVVEALVNSSNEVEKSIRGWLKLGDVIANLGKGHPLSEAEFLAQSGRRFPTDIESIRAGAGFGQSPPVAPEQAPFDTAAIQANAEAMRALGAEGQKIHNIMIDISKAELPSDLFKGLNELSAAETHQAELWAKSFDPSRPELAAERVATLTRLHVEYNAAIEAGDVAARDAATAQIDAFNRQVVAEIAATEQQQKIATFQRTQAAEAKREAEELARAHHELAITGFDEGTTRNEMIQKWGKLGSDSIVALTQALADPAHMRSAGEALSNSVAQLTEKLHEAGVPDWASAGAALTAAFRQAIADGTPESVQSAQELLSQTVEVLTSTEMWSEWEKAAKAAGDKVNVATIETAGKIEEAWSEHEQKMRELDERFGEKDRAEKSRATVDEMVDHLKQSLDRQTLDERQADQDIIESMRLVDQQRDASINQARQSADAETSRMRSQRDAGIQSARAVADAEAEHRQRLADIAARGGPDVGTQTAAENESFRRQQARFQVEQQRAAEDRRRSEQDAAVDLATRITREQADLSRHQADALTLKNREHELGTQEQADSQGRADQLKAYKLGKETEFGIDKAQLDAVEKTRQITNIDDVYKHATEAANRHLGEVAGAADRELSTTLDALEKKFPWIRSLEQFSGVSGAAQPAQSPLVNPPTGFFPALPQASGVGSGGNTTINVPITASNIVGSNAMRDLALTVRDELKRYVRGGNAP